ncbi:hypothetical protein WKK05_06040 [Nostoc sp. UHCC 0302]|uniref:hypothetical protein n=1 Tax=Nostoc sp. UHCC 0302 TaxID=3134896 RepID=UPI00311C8C80
MYVAVSHNITAALKVYVVLPGGEVGGRGQHFSTRGCALSAAMPQALRLRSVTEGAGGEITNNPSPQSPIPNPQSRAKRFN